MTQFITFEITQSVAWITFNRPAKMNAFTMELADEVKQALNTCQSDENVRCVVIRGNGKAFCSGQDLGEVIEKSKDPDFELSEIISHTYNPIISRLRALEKPVIAAVNGTAAGAGANIALACDIVIATKSANFIQAFSKIGLIPDSGGTWILPRLIGLQKATSLMMLADKISAEEAESMGMIYKAIDDELFDEVIKNTALKLATMPTKALALTKKALQESFSNNLNEQLDLEFDLQTKAGNSHDFKEGVNAFLEKRLPKFKGK